MRDYFLHAQPVDFRKKINSALFDEDDDFDLEIPMSNSTNPCTMSNSKYMHYVHLRNGKKSKAVI